MRRTIFVILALGAVGYLAFIASQPRGFTQADIDDVKASIKTEFAKQQGVSVTQVELIRKNDSELTGFARLQTAQGEIVKPCSVSLDAGKGDRWLWQCP